MKIDITDVHQVAPPILKVAGYTAYMMSAAFGAMSCYLMYSSYKSTGAALEIIPDIGIAACTAGMAISSFALGSVVSEYSNVFLDKTGSE